MTRKLSNYGNVLAEGPEYSTDTSYSSYLMISVKILMWRILQFYMT